MCSFSILSNLGLIVTGRGHYYSAGVSFSTLPMAGPSKIKALLADSIEQAFKPWIVFPKPLFVAANGPAIGAPVTSASLTDGLIAARSATFSTPFRRLGITPEGCSSVHFAKLMGQENAAKMLEQDFVAKADEALSMGLVSRVVDDQDLLETAQECAEKFVADRKRRKIIEEGLVDRYLQVNHEESVALAASFVNNPFLRNQFKFYSSKGMYRQAAVFGLASLIAPLL